MRADLIGQKMGTDAVYEGAAAVAARFNGARGVAPVTIDGELGAAWIHARAVKVAFVFHVEAGLVREESRGKWSFYAVDREAAAAAIAQVRGLLGV